MRKKIKWRENKMTITNLSKFLKTNAPNIYVEIESNRLRGKRVAIDGHNLLHRCMSIAQKEVVNRTDVSRNEPDRDEIVKRWYKRVIEAIMMFLERGITPICVLDGEHPKEKDKTKKKRREIKEKIRVDLEKKMVEIAQLDEFDKTPQMITELRKKYNQLSTCRYEEIEEIKAILDIFGIPCLIAKGDGEKLCSMLCREGKVEAVFSNDTDLIALGTPIILPEFPSMKTINRQRVDSFSAIIFEPLLSTLSLSYSTFIDLCIMSGCDYNENIPRLGVGRAYKLLKECKSIENLPQQYEDKLEILNYEFCRKIFQTETSQSLITKANKHCYDYQIHFNPESARDRLNAYECDDMLARYIPLISTLPIPENSQFRPPQKIKFILKSE